MKKSLVLIALVAAMASASALELGLRSGKNYAYDDSSAGVSLTQNFGAYSAEVAFDRVVTGKPSDRYSLVGGYDIAKFGGVTITPKVGVSFIKASTNGYAASVGVGASYNITKPVKLVVDYSYQMGQDRTSKLDGSSLMASIKYAF
jgi:opacity protein-like surface antigen